MIDNFSFYQSLGRNLQPSEAVKGKNDVFLEIILDFRYRKTLENIVLTRVFLWLPLLDLNQ